MFQNSLKLLRRKQVGFENETLKQLLFFFTFKELTRSTRRDYLLRTLSHAERRDFRRRESIDRILEISDCIKIVAARETHQNEGFHFHIGVHCTNASKNNVTKKVRNLFPEFEGMQCHVQFQKTRSAICTYVTKQDEEPETGLPTVGKRKCFYQKNLALHLELRQIVIQVSKTNPTHFHSFLP